MAPSTPSSPRHKWTDHDRAVVSLLFVIFDVSPDDITRIFNKVCGSRLLTEGYVHGMPYNTIKSQLGDLKGEGSGSKLYGGIENMSFRQVRDKYRSEKEAIEDAAQDLNIKLQLQLKNQRPSFALSVRGKRRRIEERDDTPASFVWVSDSSSDNEVIDTPSKAPRKQLRKNANLKVIIPRKVSTTLQQPVFREDTTASTRKTIVRPLRIDYDFNDRPSQRRPQFLFRTFEVSHGFTARQFLNSSEEIPPPPKLESDDFLALVTPHLHVIKPYLSPFISFAVNPRNALKADRLLPDPKFGFAIFLYNDIERDIVQRFGPDCGPYLTPVICSTHDVDDLPRSPAHSKQKYTGRGEFIIWGSVRCEPLAVLDAAEAIFLRSVLETTKSVDNDSGQRIGRCLQMVPDEWRTTVAYKLGSVFGFLDSNIARSNAQGNAFFTGVEDARCTREPIVASQSTVHITPVVVERELQGTPIEAPIPPVMSQNERGVSEYSQPICTGGRSKLYKEVMLHTQLSNTVEDAWRSEDEEPVPPAAVVMTNEKVSLQARRFPIATKDDWKSGDGWTSEDEEPVPEANETMNHKIAVAPKVLPRPVPRWNSRLEHPYISRTMTMLKSEQQIEESTLEIVRKMNQTAGYLSDDDWSSNGENEVQDIYTPPTSTETSPNQTDSGTNLTLAPSTLGIFKQQLSHFAAEKPIATTRTSKQAMPPSTPNPIIKKGSSNQPIDLTASEDGQFSTPEEEYDDIIQSIQQHRFRQHQALSLRSKSSGPC